MDPAGKDSMRHFEIWTGYYLHSKWKSAQTASSLALVSHPKMNDTKTKEARWVQHKSRYSVVELMLEGSSEVLGSTLHSEGGEGGEKQPDLQDLGGHETLFHDNLPRQRGDWGGDGPVADSRKPRILLYSKRITGIPAQTKIKCASSFGLCGYV